MEEKVPYTFTGLILVILGMGGYWAWFLTAALTPSGWVFASDQRVMTLWAVALSSVLIFLIASAITAKNLTAISYSRAKGVSGACLLSIGLTLQVIGQTFEGFFLVAVLGAVFGGIGFSAVLIFLAESFAAFRLVATQRLIIFWSLVVGILLFLLINFVPFLFAFIIVLAIPFLSILAFWMASRFSSIDYELLKDNCGSTKYIPVRVVIYSFTFVIPVSTLVSMEFFSTISGDPWPWFWVFLGVLVILVALTWIDSYLIRKVNIAFMPVFGLALMAIGIVLMVALPQYKMPAAAIFQFSGYALMQMYAFWLMGKTMVNISSNPIFVFSVGMAATVTGLVIGCIIGFLLLDFEYGFVISVGLLAIYFASLAVLLFVPKRRSLFWS